MASIATQYRKRKKVLEEYCQCVYHSNISPCDCDYHTCAKRPCSSTCECDFHQQAHARSNQFEGGSDSDNESLSSVSGKGVAGEPKCGLPLVSCLCGDIEGS